MHNFLVLRHFSFSRNGRTDSTIRAITWQVHPDPLPIPKGSTHRLLPPWEESSTCSLGQFNHRMVRWLWHLWLYQWNPPLFTGCEDIFCEQARALFRTELWNSHNPLCWNHCSWCLLISLILHGGQVASYFTTVSTLMGKPKLKQTRLQVRQQSGWPKMEWPPHPSVEQPLCQTKVQDSSMCAIN